MTASIVFGDNDSVLSSYTLGSDKKIKITNTSTTGETEVNLGTDTTATKFAVKNASGADLFSVKGDGTVTPSGSGISGDFLNLNYFASNSSGTVVQATTLTRIFYLFAPTVETSGSSIVYDDTNKYITFTGKVLVNFSFTGGNNAAQFNVVTLDLDIDGVRVNRARGRQTAGHTDMTLVISRVVEANTPTTMEIKLDGPSTGGNNLRIHCFNFSAIRL